MKHLSIGPATIASDEATLSASYTVSSRTVEGAPPVPYSTGADGYNEVLMPDGQMLIFMNRLGLSSLFFSEADGLFRSTTEGRAQPIKHWMSVRINEALTDFLTANPTAPTLDVRDELRFQHDLITWLDYWFAYALDDGAEIGPAAFYWSQS